MRGIKPFKLSFLTRPFTLAKQHHLGVTVTAFFAFDPPGTVFTDLEMWTVLADVLGPTPLDVGIPKSRAELLVLGACHAPGGRPTPTCPVTVKLGELEKTLYVIGDRVWKPDDTPTEPVPFTTMPIEWARAYGGAGYAPNPLGRGAALVKDDAGREVRPLPNLELPGKMIDSPKAAPEPAGLGAYEFHWPQRFSLAGTYDQRWFEELYPGFAADLDWRIWNLAPADQQREAPWVGDEAFEILNMHPTKPRLRGRLPGMRGRAFIVRGGHTSLEEVELRATTVWLFPALERGVVLFQGATRVREDDARDVDAIMVAAERLGEPRPLPHYQRVYEQRTGPEGRDDPSVHLRDEDLVPPGVKGFGPEIEEQMKLLSNEGLAAKRLRGQADKRVEEARALVAAEGLEPDEHGPHPLAPLPAEGPGLDELGDVFENAMKELAQAKTKLAAERERAVGEMRALYGELGLDAEEVMQELVEGHRGPPTFSAGANRAMFERLYAETVEAGHPVDELAHYARDPEHVTRMEETERQVLDSYRRSAHIQAPAFPMAEALAQAVRAEVAAQAARGESFREHDLTGAWLAGLPLEGADFTRALLESVDLSRAQLARARLEGAVLAHANLTEADLRGASLKGANLGGAKLVGANLEGADLAEATLFRTDLGGARFDGARLASALFHETSFKRASLRGISIERAIFNEISLKEADLTGARLRECIFHHVDLRGANLGGADLTRATFLECALDGVSFVNATLSNAACVGPASSWRGADFKGATLISTNLRGLDLTGSDFSGARLDKSDLSEAVLEGARFYRAVAHESMWIRARLRNAQMVSADLKGALLQKADIRGADFRGANLYAADFALVRADETTNVTDAIQLKVRARPRREEPEVPS
ncbi:MAG: DUF2169 domain-containing protein [Sandaracinaceae bacterium]|nr:DUF2169 domain-containing protein [Sandaracinaceae bacterium]